MIRIVYLIIIQIFIFGLNSQAATITRNLSDFSGVDFFGNIKVTMVVSDSNYVVMKSDVYDLSKVSSVVDGNMLKIKSNGIGDKNEVFITLFYKSINELQLDGGANLVKADTLRASSLMVKVSKGSLMAAPVVAETLTIIVGQGAEARVAGRVNNLNVSTNSGGLFEGYRLTSNVADVSAVSGGKAYVFVIQNIKARAKMGGVISYKGSPKIESIDPSSGGKIEKQ